MAKADKYAWVDGSRFSGDAGVVGRAIAKITKRLGDDETLKAKAIVEAARKPSSPLHRHIFKATDRQAAEAHRLELARHLLRSVLIVYRDGERERLVRAVVHLKGDGPADGDNGYHPIGRVLKNARTRELMISEALAEANAWRRRYAHLAELQPIFDAIGEAASALERNAA